MHFSVCTRIKPCKCQKPTLNLLHVTCECLGSKYKISREGTAERSGLVSTRICQFAYSIERGIRVATGSMGKRRYLKCLLRTSLKTSLQRILREEYFNGIFREYPPRPRNPNGTDFSGIIFVERRSLSRIYRNGVRTYIVLAIIQTRSLHSD